MVSRFEFATATRIIFGNGTAQEAAPLAASFGKRALIVTGKSTQRAEKLAQSLHDLGLSVSFFPIDGEPRIEAAAVGAAQARHMQADCVIGFGGGGALDGGKAIAALATNAGDPLDYLEVIGKAQPLQHPPLPYIALPTTSGTGSEVTRNAVLTSTEKQVKVSLRNALMLPRIAIVDPELTYSMPPEVTATTGLDALTQLIEPFTCNRPNPLTDSICREGIGRVAWALERAFEDGSDIEARAAMSMASLFGGMALANARLGAVHGFAAPIGGMFGAPHGAICAALLPHTMRANIIALQADNSDFAREVLSRYEEIALLLDADADPMDGVERVSEICQKLRVPRLREIGIRRESFDAIVEKARNASSMQGNSVKLTDEALHSILDAAY
ncbi:MAG: iron-containing alcohol dehydrogenase [Anaerolineae bacterium]